jgi:hypothetical protein
MNRRIGGFPRIRRPVPTVVDTGDQHSAEPVDNDIVSDDHYMDLDVVDSARPEFTETPFEDLDAPIITEPLQPPPRPEPTVLPLLPVRRTEAPPIRQPGSGLRASNIGRTPRS